MDAITPKGQLADDHSHLVKPADMEWKPTRFAGCEVKTLLMDPKTGLMTALMRFAPGATLPDHEHRAKLGNGDIFGFGVDALVGEISAALTANDLVAHVNDGRVPGLFVTGRGCHAFLEGMAGNHAAGEKVVFVALREIVLIRLGKKLRSLVRSEVTPPNHALLQSEVEVDLLIGGELHAISRLGFIADGRPHTYQANIKIWGRNDFDCGRYIYCYRTVQYRTEKYR